MKTNYDEIYCLGVNLNKFKPEINNYCSWDELASSCKSGHILNGVVPKKDDMPGVTFKGDYGSYRSTEHFKGNRSPYIVVDIDFDEKTNGFAKADLKNNLEQFKKVSSDIDFIIEFLAEDYFFLKRSSSRCGIHFVIRMDGLPTDLYEAKGVEEMIFARIQSDINTFPLFFKYNVDLSMSSTSRVFYLSYDPNLIYNPNYKKAQMSIEWIKPATKPYSGKRITPTEYDKTVFINYANECELNHIRLEHTDIFKLSILYFQLWKDESEEHYISFFKKFNKERSITRKDAGYLKRMMEEGKAANESNTSRKIGMSTLYKMAGVEPKSPFADLLKELGM